MVYIWAMHLMSRERSRGACHIQYCTSALPTYYLPTTYLPST